MLPSSSRFKVTAQDCLLNSRNAFFSALQTFLNTLCEIMASQLLPLKRTSVALVALVLLLLCFIVIVGLATCDQYETCSRGWNEKRWVRLFLLSVFLIVDALGKDGERHGLL